MAGVSGCAARQACHSVAAASAAVANCSLANCTTERHGGGIAFNATGGGGSGGGSGAHSAIVDLVASNRTKVSYIRNSDDNHSRHDFPVNLLLRIFHFSA
jgi:hypothetical protein